MAWEVTVLTVNSIYSAIARDGLRRIILHGTTAECTYFQRRGPRRDTSCEWTGLLTAENAEDIWQQAKMPL